MENIYSSKDNPFTGDLAEKFDLIWNELEILFPLRFKIIHADINGLVVNISGNKFVCKKIFVVNFEDYIIVEGTITYKGEYQRNKNIFE